jgi:hypothetical protein
MKQFKVTFTAILEMPDDFELSTSSPDAPGNPGFLCLKRGNQYYQPTLDWLEGSVEQDSKPEGPANVVWSSLDDDMAQEFLNAASEELYDIEDLGTEPKPSAENNPPGAET